MHLWLCYFDKGGKNIQWGKKQPLQKTVAGKTEQLHVKEKKKEYFLMPYTKINSKWINVLNARPETKKNLENIGDRTLDYIKQTISSMTHFLE